jgi:hypothetical protein
MDTTDAHTPFHEWLKGHARGTLDDELTAALAEVVEAVAHLEKPGKIVLELKVDVAGSGGRTVVTSGKVTTKPPEPAAEVSLFYVGEGGSLHREDPFQTRMPVGDARRIDPATGRPVTEEAADG